MLHPFAISRFAGLKLDAEPGELGPNQAIDLLDAELDRQGSVRSRDGYTHFLASNASQKLTVLAPFYRRANPTAPQLLAIRTDGAVIAYNNSGTALSTTTIPAGYESGPYNFARVGTTSAEYIYAGYRKTGTQQVYRWDGASASQLNMSYGGRYLAVQVTDNRMVMANLNVPDSSSVRFSDPGAPETLGANNYVTLSPGDGEEITGLGAWREFVFVGKPSKFFVFYGNSTDGTGNPVFNYKTVSAGVGPSAQYCSCPGRDGWYFLSKDGVYVTTGGTPELISADITPLFNASQSPFFASNAINQQQLPLVKMGWVGNRLLIAYPSGTGTANDRLLVWNPATGQWLLWSIPVNGMCAFAPSPGSSSVSAAGTEELFFSYSAGNNQVGRFSFIPGTYTTDDGAAITSARYRSGFYTVGNSSSQEAVVRESILDGVGTPTFSVSKNFSTALPTTGGGAKQAVPLGVSPAYGQGRHRVAQNGQRFSYQIEGTAPWRVTSIVQQIRSVRPPGERSA